MDIQIVNVRLPAELARRAKQAAGPGKLTAFIIAALEARLSPLPTTPLVRTSPEPNATVAVTIGKAADAGLPGDPFDRVHGEPSSGPDLSRQVQPRFKK